MKRILSQFRLGIIAAPAVGLFCCMLIQNAHADMTIYTDSLQNGWQDWSSPPGVVDWQNTAYVHSGSYAAAVTLTKTTEINSSFLFAHDIVGIDIRQFATVDFWINGGPTGGQALGLLVLAPTAQALVLGDFQPLPANTWQHVSYPLGGLQGEPTIYVGFLFLTAYNESVPTFFVDDITLVSVPEPASATLLGVGLLGVWAIRRKAECRGAGR